jgi:hypothetical protein
MKPIIQCVKYSAILINVNSTVNKTGIKVINTTAKTM